MKAIITDYQYENVNQEKSLIEGAGYMLVAHTTSTPEGIIAAASDADAVITQYCNIDERIISRLQHCRVIIKYGIGINNIDVDAASRRGIYVCNVPDYGVDEVSNHAISLATVYKGNIIKNLIMDCQSYTKYRPNETTGGIFVSCAGAVGRGCQHRAGAGAGKDCGRHPLP